jgi:hypothetical protein
MQHRLTTDNYHSVASVTHTLLDVRVHLAHHHVRVVFFIALVAKRAPIKAAPGDIKLGYPAAHE